MNNIHNIVKAQERLRALDDKRCLEVRENVRQCLGKLADKKAIARIEQNKIYPQALYEKLAEGGFTAFPVPKGYGGAGRPFNEVGYVLEELGKVTLSLSTLYITTCVFGTYSLLLFGDDKKKKKFLPEIAKGKIKFALACTEPEAGSDFANQQTRAEKKNGKYIVNGHKIWISGAEKADYLITSVRTQYTEPKHKGISILLVPAETRGITYKRIEKIGMRSLMTNEVFFKNAQVDKSALFGEENKGFYHFASLMDYERLAASCQFIGLAEAPFLDAVDFAQKRIQFDKPIASFQAISHILAECLTKILQMKTFVRTCTKKRSEGSPCPLEASMAKMVSAELVWDVAQKSMRVLGSHGYRSDVDMHRYFLDSFGAELGGGTSQIQKNIIARALGLQ